MASFSAELSEPLERFVPIGAILAVAPGREGLLVFRGELSGLEVVVAVV